MKITIEFNTDNSSFEDAPEYELDIILAFVKNQIRRRLDGDTVSSKIIDLNGNTIGTIIFGQHPRIRNRRIIR